MKKCLCLDCDEYKEAMNDKVPDKNAIMLAGSSYAYRVSDKNGFEIKLRYDWVPWCIEDCPFELERMMRSQR